MRAALLAVCLLLAACESAPKREVVARVEQAPPIRIPVPIRCVSLRELPPIPGTNLRPGSDPEQKFNQLIADVDDFREYAIRVEAILKGCATEPVGVTP